MKFNFIDEESLKSVVEEKLVNLNNVDQLIITQIINPQVVLNLKIFVK